MKAMPPLLVAIILSLLSLAGCDGNKPQSNLPTADVKVGQRTYTLEIAAKDEERNNGLMRRDSMPDDHGMIFLFKEPKVLRFWMKNTRIPLDILYLDAAGKVVSIHRMEPYVEDATVSKGEAKYAIELNAGQAEKAGVKEGDTIPLPDNVTKIIPDP